LLTFYPSLRIAVSPLFKQLRRFKHGRRFKQWTGNDSKALMKVCAYTIYSVLISKAIIQVLLPALEGYVPAEIIQTFHAFLDFSYLVRKNVIDEDTLDQIDDALARFHKHRVIFQQLGLRDDFNLPRQHVMKHYQHLIELFGAPNGLCTSITESAHIKAVKKTWRRASKGEPLWQMLVINQRLHYLAASQADFRRRNMLHGDSLTAFLMAELQASVDNESDDESSHESDGWANPQDEGTGDNSHDENEEHDDDGPVNQERIDNEVELAKTKGKCTIKLHTCQYLMLVA
jgi:hypothetical protein